MREIIHIQVGQCGNRISSSFWETISEEHGILPSGDHSGGDAVGHCGVFYNEYQSGRYTPRAVLVDLEPGSVDEVRGGTYGKLFKPDSFIVGHHGTGNNWSNGYYREGPELIQPTMEAIRKEAEACDSLQGFQLAHSIGGGTGGGMGSLLLSVLREEYRDKMFCTLSVLPSIRAPHLVVDPYNTLLTLNQLIENTDQVVCMDNDVMDICWRLHKIPQPTIGNLNHLIGSAMAGITSTLRFPSTINNDLRKMAVNLVPFPRLHFLLVSRASLKPGEHGGYPSNILGHTFDPRYIMANVDIRHGRFLNVFSLYRSNLKYHPFELHWSVSAMNSSYFVEWIPNNVKYFACRVPEKSSEITSTMIGNNTVIQQIFRQSKDAFYSMFNRRAFLHHFNNMDDTEFLEAAVNVSDLIEEYQMYQDASIDDYEDNDMEDDWDGENKHA